MPAMKRWLVGSLAFLALAGPGSAATPAPTTKKPASAPAPAAGDGTVLVHRCTDARGHVTLQDDPCPAGSRDETRSMTRPKDPPQTVQAPPLPQPAPEPLAPEEPYQRPELIPPPPMYHCTSYDGIERFSESYDPNPRCEPIVLYYPYPNELTPSQKLACRWVEDSCVRLSDRAACARWKTMQVEAKSAVLHAFSDTAAYRKSELARLNQIVEESCP